MVLCCISPPFGRLSTTRGKITYVLLTRAPLYRGLLPFSCDLHVLGAPLTFVLSQDQTLQLNLETSSPEQAPTTWLGSSFAPHRTQNGVGEAPLHVFHVRFSFQGPTGDGLPARRVALRCAVFFSTCAGAFSTCGPSREASSNSLTRCESTIFLRLFAVSFEANRPDGLGPSVARNRGRRREGAIYSGPFAVQGLFFGDPQKCEFVGKRATFAG